MLINRKPRTLLFLFLLVSLVLAGCGGNEASGEPTHLAPLESMPEEVQNAPVTVQQAYQFAVANPAVLGEMPCYCGCGSMGHTSNYACYVAGENPDGSVQFDEHALGCSICVDITLDTMRLLGEDKPVSEIRAYIDSTYAQYGPSNIP